MKGTTGKKQLKKAIHDWITVQTKPFTTRDVMRYSKTVAPCVALFPARIGRYIKSTGLVDINKSTNEWSHREPIAIAPEQKTLKLVDDAKKEQR